MKINNSNRKKILFFLFLFLLIFLLWGNSIYYGQFIETHYQSVSIRLKDSKVSQTLIQKIAEEEYKKDTSTLKRITAWNVTEQEPLVCDALGTKAKIRLIKVYGDMEQAYPIVLESGGIPVMGDEEGCLIDEETAYELFHTRNAVGGSVTVQQHHYRVRGILNSKEPVCLLMTSQKEESYSNLEIVFPDQEDGSKLAADLFRQYGLNNSYIAIDGMLFGRLLQLAYLLPAWLLGICLLYDLITILWRRRGNLLQAIVLLLGIILLGAVLARFMEFEFYFPQSFLPTKWSDFSFWSKNQQTFLEWLKSISYLTPNEKDLIFQQYTLRCLFYTGTATIGMLALITHERLLLLGNRKAGSFLLLSLVEGIAVTLLFTAGKSIIPPRAYLGMPILYMMVEDVFLWFRRKEKA